MYKDDEVMANKLSKYRVVYADLIDIIIEGINPLDAKIRALNKLHIDWESAPLATIEAIPVTKHDS